MNLADIHASEFKKGIDGNYFSEICLVFEDAAGQKHYFLQSYRRGMSIGEVATVLADAEMVLRDGVQG